MMYVVRLDRAGDKPDFKVFAALPGARQRFRAAVRDMPDGDFEAAFLFEAPGAENAYAAVMAVNAGGANLLERDPWKGIQRGVHKIVADWIASRDVHGDIQFPSVGHQGNLNDRPRDPDQA